MGPGRRENAYLKFLIAGSVRQSGESPECIGYSARATANPGGGPAGTPAPNPPQSANVRYSGLGEGQVVAFSVRTR